MLHYDFVKNNILLQNELILYNLMQIPLMLFKFQYVKKDYLNKQNIRKIALQIIRSNSNFTLQLKFNIQT